MRSVPDFHADPPVADLPTGGGDGPVVVTAPGRGGSFGGWRSWVQRSVAAVRAVLLPWFVARVIVVGVLLVSRVVVDHRHFSPATVARVHEGLLGWDAGWYEALAHYGYGLLGHQSLRFFPLFPLAARALALATGISDGASVVVLANLGALVGTAMLVVLVERETGDRRWALRTAWLFSLAPPAFSLVMGYAEGPLLACTVGCFLALRPGAGTAVGAGTRVGAGTDRRPRWTWVVVSGFAAALTRPLGGVLVLPVAVEALRGWRGWGWRTRWAAVAGVLAPVAGAGAFLAWSAAAFGNGLLPVTVQTQSGHHGGLSDPLRVLAHDALGAFHGHVGTALHVPWVVLVVALVVVCWRRLPAPYAAFATGIVLVALSGTNLSSFERYALSAFPLVMAASTFTASTRVERTVLAVSAFGLACYAGLAFFNLLVP